MNPPEKLHPAEMISAYLDGAIGPEEQALVEEHLGSCPRCREMVEDLRALAATAARDEPPPVPADLATRIGRLVEVARGRAGPFRRPAWRSPFALAAAGLAVATLVWLAVRQQAPAPTSLPVTGPVAQKPAALEPAAGIIPPAPVARQTGDKTAPKKTAPGGTETKTRDLRSLENGEPGAVEEKPAMDESSPEDALQTAKERDVMGAVLSDGGRSDEPMAASRAKGKRSSTPGGETQSALGSARESVVPRAAPGPRSLLYETPDISLFVSEEGLVTLILRGYACSVNVAPPATAEGESSLPPELESLFTRASSREILASAVRTAIPETPSAEEAAARPKTITLRDSEGGTLYTVAYGDSPETAPPRAALDLEEEIRRTVWLRFRKNLEERCGSIPGVPPGSVP